MSTTMEIRKKAFKLYLNGYRQDLKFRHGRDGKIYEMWEKVYKTFTKPMNQNFYSNFTERL